MSDASIYARSDVARDIIQNSNYFTSVGKAVAEYVWNSIDYCKPGASVEVHVNKRRGKLTVRQHRQVKYNGIVIEETKNGGGMSRETLQRFFTMHGETQARKEGRRVRGRFGTGKAAAFGIGNSLIVDSIKDGRRNVVALDREQLMVGKKEIEVKSLLTNQPVENADGTTIIIDHLILKKLKMESARKFLGRSIGLLLRNHNIYIDGKKLEYYIPAFEKEWKFRCLDDREALLGDCELVLRQSKKELEREEQGVAILAEMYPMEILDLYRAGTWSTRLFGEVDVKLLDSPDAIPAFDNTRSKLNRDNPRVSSLLQWVDECVDQVVSDLTKEARSKMDSEELAKLKQTADELANLLNDDFAHVMEMLESSPTIGGIGNLESGVQAMTPGTPTYMAQPEGPAKVALDEDGGVTLLKPEGDGGHAIEPVADVPATGKVGDEGIDAKEATTSGEKKKRRGGFKIAYVKQGEEAPRAKFVRENMTIELNLDYPELAIFEGNVQDARFKALSAEIVVSEYAIATVNLEVEYGYVDVADKATDALFEYRRIINRLGRSVVPLMTKWFGNVPEA